jgi:endonuclease G
MSASDDARRLIAEGEINSALDLIEGFVQGRIQGPNAPRAESLYDELLTLRARIRRLARDIRQGTITNSGAQAERVRQDQSALGLISEIERMDQLRSPSVSIDLSGEIAVEKLMGTESQLRSTGWLGEGLRIGSAVCRLTNDHVFGTGFRCREDLIMTNHHVIRNVGEARSFKAEFFFEEEMPGRRLRVPDSVPLAPERIFWTSEILDITVVAIDEIPRTPTATANLSASPKPALGDHVSIVQHPSGGPKQIAVTNNRIVNFKQPYVQYVTDTLPGSSGSPVFSDDWKVIAIHHAGGNVRKNSRGDVIFANEGVLVRDLLSDPEFSRLYLKNP